MSKDIRSLIIFILAYLSSNAIKVSSSPNNLLVNELIKIGACGIITCGTLDIIEFIVNKFKNKEEI